MNSDASDEGSAWYRLLGGTKVWRKVYQTVPLLLHRGPLTIYADDQRVAGPQRAASETCMQDFMGRRVSFMCRVTGCLYLYTTVPRTAVHLRVSCVMDGTHVGKSWSTR